jgi:hypothetical protein
VGARVSSGNLSPDHLVTEPTSDGTIPPPLTHYPHPTPLHTRSLLDTLYVDFYPHTVGEWSTWLQDTLPVLLPQTDPSGNPSPLRLRPLLPDYGVVVGGVRVTQRRGIASECPLGASFASVYPYACHGASSSSSSSDGAFAPFAVNTTQAEMDGVLPSFSAKTVAGDAEGAGFHFFASAYEDVAVSAALVELLNANGWLDRFTSSLAVRMTVLNPELAYLAHVHYDADFTRGGWVETGFGLTSLCLNTYALFPGAALLDIALLLYLLYLLGGTIKRTVRALIAKRAPSADDDIRTGAARRPLCGGRLARLLSWGAALDWGTVLALASVMIVLGRYEAALADVRALLKDLPPPVFDSGDTSTDSSGVGNSTSPGGGEEVFVPEPNPPAWAALEQAVDNAAALHASFKEAGIYALIFLALRLFKYVGFQARLAVMAKTLILAFDDMFHFGVLFTILFVCYGAWGHFAFGTQMLQWSGAGRSITTVFQFLMYDYDLDAMRLAGGETADFYYASFMMLMTNLMLWMVSWREGWVQMLRKRRHALTHHPPHHALPSPPLLVSSSPSSSRTTPSSAPPRAICRP